MDAMASDRFRQVLALAAADPEYQALQRECEELDKRVLGALEKLPPKDRSVIREYIRVLGASALRLTEIACETM